MLKLLLRCMAYGLAGAVIFPPLVFFLGLLLSYTFDPHCGGPYDSGGCEMGAAGLAFGSILPGLIIGIILAVLRTARLDRRRSDG